MVARLQLYLGFLLFEMYSVVFVTALYSRTAMSLTLVKEHIYIYIYKLILKCQTGSYLVTEAKIWNDYIHGL